MPFCIGLTFISFVFMDDWASSSAVLVSRLKAKLKSKEVRFLFFQISSTYTNKTWSLDKNTGTLLNWSLGKTLILYVQHSPINSLLILPYQLLLVLKRCINCLTVNVHRINHWKKVKNSTLCKSNENWWNFNRITENSIPLSGILMG